METKKFVTAANNVICKVLGIIAFAMCATNLNAQILSSLLGGGFSSNVHLISNQIIYEGKTKKKMPNGNGRIHILSFDYTKYNESYNNMFTDDGKLRNMPYCYQDLISGTFNGNNVSSAFATFSGVKSANWAYKGDMIINLQGENVQYILLPEGVIDLGHCNSIMKDEFVLTDTVIVTRSFTDFSLETPYILLMTHLAFKSDNPNYEYFGIPSSFFKYYATYFEIRNKDGWSFKCNSSYPGVKRDKSEQITYSVENCRSSKVIFGDKSWYKRYKDNSGNVKVSFFANIKDGTIRTSADEKKNNLSQAEIKFKNGGSYKGTIRIVTAKKGNRMADGQKYIIPSILESDSYFFKNLSIKDNIIFVDGVYQDAGGLSTVYEGGYDDNERQEMAIAKANKEKAVKQANEEAARKRANKIAETKKLLPKLYGKTFSYNQYYDYYVAWSKHNGNASIKFSANRQDIFLRVGSTTTWLKLSEITNNGDLECIQAGSRNLADVCYITPYLDNGKISFIIDLLGGFKYRLSK